jgi:hypothetical protein
VVKVLFRFPSRRKISIQHLRRKAGPAVLGGDFGIDMPHRRPGLKQSTADVERDGADWCRELHAMISTKYIFIRQRHQQFL